MAQALRYIDYLLPNAEEAKLLTGEKTVEEAARALQECGVTHVVVKCGSRGCYVLEEKAGYWVLPKHPVNCIDTTGAGDSFAGGFLAALSEGKDIRECARFANQCGGKAVSCVGAVSWLE